MSAINEFALTFLLNAVWQIAVVTLAACVCARFLRDAPARFRHALWVSALALGIALPVWSGFNFSVDAKERLSTPPTNVRESAAPVVVSPATQQTNGSVAQSQSVSPFESLLQKRRQTLPSMPPVTFAVLFAYALFMLYRLNALRRAWRRTQDIRRTAYAREIPDEMKRVAAHCGGLFNLKNVRVECSAKVDAPVTIGWHAPVIILPESFFAAGLTAETLASVLGHEMAHIARRDFLLNLIYEVLRLPISFHPLAHLATRQINRTRELACDELVAGRVIAADAYARSLVRMASSLTSPAGHAYSLGVFDADILEERVMRLIKNRARMSVRAGRVVMAASFALLLAAALTTSVFSLGFRSAENKITAAAQEQRTPQAQADVAEKIKALASADANTRAAAACALGHIGHKGASAAIPALIQMLGDDAAIEPFKCWGENGSTWTPALAIFKQASPGEEAAIALAASGQSAVEPLIAALGHPSASVRRNAAWAIGEVTGGRMIKRESAVEPLRSALSDGDEWVRAAAARALGEINDNRAAESLIAALADGSARVRETAAWSLGEMKERRAVQSLGVMLLKDEQPDARAMAAWALGEIQDPKAVESLQAALNDTEPRVRAKAKWALSEILPDDDTDGSEEDSQM
ncbi:MAG TPA: M56 family metallopeptidase [Pyrinomonadaceae bacterium]|nr:M56 family metallopeptidase [Pyrinomonadaceae bacterium]